MARETRLWHVPRSKKDEKCSESFVARCSKKGCETIHSRALTVCCILCIVAWTPAFGQIPYGVDGKTVALWTFDDSVGPAVLDSTGVNNGIASSGTTIVPGRFALARQFRGSGAGDLVTVPDNLSLRPLSQITIEAWIYPTSFDLALWNSGECIVSKGDEGGIYNHYELSIHRNDPTTSATSFTSFTIGMSFANNGVGSAVDSVITHRPGEWYYVVGTYDGERSRIYVNGVLEAVRGGMPGAVVTTTDPLYINNHTFFNRTASSQGRMGGIIDAVRISSVARTADEIADVFAKSGPFWTPTPTGSAPTATPTPTIPGLTATPTPKVANPTATPTRAAASPLEAVPVLAPPMLGMLALALAVMALLILRRP